jgi:mRNA interferase HicA
MKCSALMKILKKNGWFAISQKGSHVKMMHAERHNVLIVPNHGSAEVGKGLERKILKDAGIK